MALKLSNLRIQHWAIWYSNDSLRFVKDLHKSDSQLSCLHRKSDWEKKYCQVCLSRYFYIKSSDKEYSRNESWRFLKEKSSFFFFFSSVLELRQRMKREKLICFFSKEWSSVKVCDEWETKLRIYFNLFVRLGEIEPILSISFQWCWNWALVLFIDR